MITKHYKKLFFLTILFSLFQINLKADVAHYVDFKYILNESKAGSGAQEYLKKKLSNGIKNLKDKEKSIQEEEKRIIKQKKALSADDYKKQVSDLRNKVSSLQKERDILLDSVAKQRAKARSELLKNLNPIMKEYMQANKIRIILDKKGILLADENLDVTDEITDLLNKKIKTIKLN